MKTRLNFVAAVVAIAALAACSQQTAEQKVTANTSKVYYLKPEEVQLADIKAKQFYNKQWPQKQQDGSVGQTPGFFTECRPSDSNANGLVTCHGKVPNINGGYNDVDRYCPYRPNMAGGCNDQDTAP